MYDPLKFSHLALIIILLFTTFLFGTSCSSSGSTVETNANKANNATDSNKKVEKINVVSDNVDELLNIIRLPEVPEDVVWKEETLGKNDNRVPGPTDKKLTAVLKYTTENAAKIVALEQKNKAPEQAEIGAETWFPEELVAQSQISGNESLKGTAYGANDFFNIPYGNGKITRIEGTDYFVLELLAN